MFFSAFVFDRSPPNLCPGSAGLSRILGVKDLVQLLQSSSLGLNLHKEPMFSTIVERVPNFDLRKEVYKGELEEVQEDEKDIEPVADLCQA